MQFGLYATLFPLAAYGLLATSRQHVIGPDAALSALTAADARAARHRGWGVDPALYAVLAAGLAIAIGGLLVLAGVLHLGFIGDFFGKPVLLGYINGVAVIVIFGQLEKLLGITVDASHGRSGQAPRDRLSPDRRHRHVAVSPADVGLH